MTTIIVHGTAAAAEPWYYNSWSDGGFCRALADALIRAVGTEDVWKINGTPVSEVPELNPPRSLSTGRIGQISQRHGFFIWSGDYTGTTRLMAGRDLAKYLSVIANITNEPIRVVAHSHGCNVLKAASTSKQLDPKVYIDRAVFLACPHMSGTGTGEILYPLNPTKFGKIGNFYSERDMVVKNIANKFATPAGYKMEVSESSFIDSDINSEYVYENYSMRAPTELSDKQVHGWLHSEAMAYTIGWRREGYKLTNNKCSYSSSVKDRQQTPLQAGINPQSSSETILWQTLKPPRLASDTIPIETSSFG